MSEGIMSNEQPTIRLGLIGAGPWGRTLIRTINEMSGVTLARVGSTNPETRSLVGPGCTVVEDWTEVLNPTDIHGVIIATPPALHFDMVREALAANIPVLVEKPLTLNVREATSLRQIATVSQGLVMVDHTHLGHPAYRAIKEFSGAVGPIRAIRGLAGNWGPFRSDVSVLWDWGPHDLAMAIDLLNSGIEYASAVVTERRETPDGIGETPGGIGETIDIRLDFSDEIDARFVFSNLLPEKRRVFAVHFDRLVMVYNPLRPEALTLHPPTDNFATPEDAGEAIALPDEQPLANAIMTFAMAIAGGVNDLGSLNLGVDVVAALARCQASLNEKAGLKTS